MTSYNRTKAEDRKREIADLKDEIAAVDAGKWPRDLRDSLKILGIPFLDAAEDVLQLFGGCVHGAMREIERVWMLWILSAACAVTRIDTLPVGFRLRHRLRT